MDNKPKVSVIIPTYNDGESLISAIESVIQQSFSSIEIIVIDDGSTNDIKNILNTYIESNKITYFLQEHSGVGVARDKGIQMSKGEYIAFIDSDDEWIDTDKIKKQVEFLDKNKEYILVGTGVINIDTNGKEINKYLMPENNEEIRNKMLRINCFVNSSVLFRKYPFEVIGMSESILEDYDLWLRLGKIGKFKNLPIYAVKYCIKFYGNGTINKIVRLKENLILSKKYKNNYPSYLKAFILGHIKIYFYPLFEILPLKIKGVLLKFHKKL